MKKVVAHGTFDIIHFGHINYLEKAKSYGDYLIVFVTSDKECIRHNKENYFDENIRLRMIKSLKCVDEVILRDTNLIDALKTIDYDILVTTDPIFKENKEITKSVILLDRTEGISTTLIKNYLKKEEK